MTDREFWLGVRQDIDSLNEAISALQEAGQDTQQRLSLLEKAGVRAGTFWTGFRQGILMILDGLERWRGYTPRTAELRKEAKRR